MKRQSIIFVAGVVLTAASTLAAAPPLGRTLQFQNLRVDDASGQVRVDVTLNRPKEEKGNTPLQLKVQFTMGIAEAATTETVDLTLSPANPTKTVRSTTKLSCVPRQPIHIRVSDPVEFGTSRIGGVLTRNCAK